MGESEREGERYAAEDPGWNQTRVTAVQVLALVQVSYQGTPPV